MGHIHPDVVIDGDSKRFVIDPITRAIKNETPKLLLIKDDHNSERYTFELPRFVEGHDMSLCNKVEVHYININSSNRALPPNTGIYPIQDIATEIIDGVEKITGSWLISGAVTEHAGPLSFAVRFACVVDGKTVYSWNTLPHTGITISDGINVSDEIAKEYDDLLQSWWNSLQAAFNARTLTLAAGNDIAPNICPDTIECEPDETVTVDYVGIHVLAKYPTANKYGQRTVMGAIVIGENGELSLNNCFYVEGRRGLDGLTYNAVLDYEEDINTKRDWSSEYKYFNREPEVGESFYILGRNINDEVFKLLCKVTALREFVDYEIIDICSLKGDRGYTGAKLVSQTFSHTDSYGNNVYNQVFDDGTTATFTAKCGLPTLTFGTRVTREVEGTIPEYTFSKEYFYRANSEFDIPPQHGERFIVLVEGTGDLTGKSYIGLGCVTNYDESAQMVTFIVNSFVETTGGPGMQALQSLEIHALSAEMQPGTKMDISLTGLNVESRGTLPRSGETFFQAYRGVGSLAGKGYLALWQVDYYMASRNAVACTLLDIVEISGPIGETGGIGPVGPEGPIGYGITSITIEEV